MHTESPFSSFNSGRRSPDAAKMEWIGPVLIGIVVVMGVIQLFWAHAISTIAHKTDQSELMQVLAWIPLLQIAPTLAAGGGSIGRALLGMIALGVGNAALMGMASLLGGGFGSGVAALGMGFTFILCIFYFGRITCNTAVARDLPGWMGLLLFVPILNFFVYPYFAFHDGWSGPNKIGLVIGSVLVLAGMAPSFQAVRMLNENGGFSSELLLAMNDPQFAKPIESADFPSAIIVDAADRPSIERPVDSSQLQPALTQNQDEAIRVLYQLKGRFDTLESLATPENLLIHDLRVRALGIIQSIRTNLEAQRDKLDDSTYEELAMHLLAIEARVHTGSSVPPARRRIASNPRGSQYAPAAPDPAGSTRAPSYIDAHTPPVRPFPVQASNECPRGTESRSRADERGGEDWCQQLPEYGGLRHGWYARYHKDGRPESMGQYQEGLRVGVWTRFYPTGEVRAQAEFQKGLQHGWVLTFNQAGERTRSARFEDGAAVDSN